MLVVVILWSSSCWSSPSITTAMNSNALPANTNTPFNPTLPHKKITWPAAEKTFAEAIHHRRRNLHQNRLATSECAAVSGIAVHRGE
mmetsp:Transcript_17304/g.48753  ORF Transcript_17304/g.48753 Transcript_17304/m.48753 type:complete len:87 (+) Transcript_17304:152-412(+)